MSADAFSISDVTLVPGSAFAIWGRYLSPIYDLETADGLKEEAFFVHNTTLRLPRAVLFYTRSAAAVLKRTSAKVELHPLDNIILQMCLTGSISFSSGEQGAVLEPGDIVLLDLMSPSLQQCSESTSITLMLARSRVPPSLRSSQAHGAKLSADHPSARCLKFLAQMLIEASRETTPAEIESILDGVLAIAQAAWAAAQAEAAPHRDRLLYERAVAMMRSEAASLSFNPDRLARNLGVSRSRLYMLFTSQGGISRAMLNLRLDASLATLVTRTGSRGLVSEAAHALGFQSEAHFSRAFRKRFGFAPSRVVKYLQSGMEPAGREAVAEAVQRNDIEAVTAMLRSGLSGEPLPKAN